MEAFSVEADIPGGASAAAEARQILRDELAGRLSASLLADIALLLTELMANGVRHGGGDEGTELHVLLERRPATVRVEVVNPDRVPATVGLRPPDLRGGGGLGLHIVERLSSRWGVHDGPRITVWFELDCEPADLL
jgi:anti-sigma regulatory factor (Ser/Thr protein kinase)